MKKGFFPMAISEKWEVTILFPFSSFFFFLGNFSL